MLLDLARALLLEAGFDEASQRVSQLTVPVVGQGPHAGQIESPAGAAGASAISALATAPSELVWRLVACLMTASITFVLAYLVGAPPLIAAAEVVAVFVLLVLWPISVQLLGFAKVEGSPSSRRRTARCGCRCGPQGVAELDHPRRQQARGDREFWTVEVEHHNPYDTLLLSTVDIIRPPLLGGNQVVMALDVHRQLEHLSWEQWLGYRADSVHLDALLSFRLQKGRRPMISFVTELASSRRRSIRFSPTLGSMS